MLSEQNEIKLVELFKICTKCRIPKHIDEFYKDKRGKFGVVAVCKTCAELYNKIRYVANKKVISAKAKVYREKHKDKETLRHKLYHDANKNNPVYIKKRRACGKNYYKTHKEKRKKYSEEYYKNEIHRKERTAWSKAYNKAHKEAQRAYYFAHKEEKKAYSINYYLDEINREKRRERNKIYKKQRRKIDPKFRLNCNISIAVSRFLKNGKNGKSWKKLVDYTLSDLKKHLEKQFIAGMTWDNYGKGGWVVDHKVPVSAFNFTKPGHRDFKRCWALKNLQPMWEKENLEKQDKLDKHFQPSLLL